MSLSFYHRTYPDNNLVLSFLPPANEVWGKVMFLHLCVILFKGGFASGKRGLRPGSGVCIHRKGGLHPGLPNGYYEIQSTSGRYASYWNASLLYVHHLLFSLTVPIPFKEQVRYVSQLSTICNRLCVCSGKRPIHTEESACENSL